MVQILDRIPACDFLAIHMEKKNETPPHSIVYYQLVNYNFKIKLIALIKILLNLRKFKFQKSDRSDSNCFN
jgi:hypothetical protein